MSGYDVLRGTIPPPDIGLSTLTQLACDLAPAAVGSQMQTTSTLAPAVGQAFYYVVGHSNPTTGSKDALGTRSDGTIEVSPVSCP